MLCLVFSHVRFFVTPWTIACQASLSMGFSRQEHRSGLPCPPPGDLPTQGSNLGLLHYRWILLSEPSGKPKNTRVTILSLLQGIFPTQGLNQGLLHCRQILYQLSHQGSPWYPYLVPQNKARETGPCQSEIQKMVKRAASKEHC